MSSEPVAVPTSPRSAAAQDGVRPDDVPSYDVAVSPLVSVSPALSDASSSGGGAGRFSVLGTSPAAGEGRSLFQRLRASGGAPEAAPGTPPLPPLPPGARGGQEGRPKLDQAKSFLVRAGCCAQADTRACARAALLAIRARARPPRAAAEAP